ncbi:LCP family protein [Halonatronum saccharophilum]|uniref:LCP family protein n=1 Tax=Halonatronum saccharophilum TaxID=150060 RepID=UPI000484992E|nr:LCP family protein [Halonatronum saccharophilum]
MSLKSKTFRIIGLALIIFLVVFGTGIFGFNLFSPFRDQFEDEDLEEVIKEDRTLNFLLLGIDSAHNGDSRADTLMILSLDLDSNKAGIISIPRDTRVKLSGRDHHSKINTAYAEGGPSLTKEAVEGLLETDVDYYLELDYQGFIEIVNSLGGVELEIEQDMYYVDQADDLYINLKAGRRRLDGEESLDYVRYREELFADIGRIERQQKFLEAALDEAMKFRTILKVPELVQIINRNVSTDLGLSRMLQLGSFLYNFEEDNLEMLTLPGDPRYISGVSYWYPHKDEIELLVDSLVRNKYYFNNSKLNLRISNGSGRVGVARGFANILGEQGYTVEGIANADRYDYSKTLVFAPEDKADDLRSLVEYLNADLRLEEERALIEVIIGKDIVERKIEQGLFS